jgi:hypothetical protein
MARKQPELDAFRKGVYDEFHRTTVGELIAQLQALDPDSAVVFSVSGAEGGAAPTRFHAIVEPVPKVVHIQLDEITRTHFNAALREPAFRDFFERRRQDAAPAQTVQPKETLVRRLSKLKKGLG